MEQTKENKMGVMPVNKLLVTMSLPIVISMLIQAMYNLVDSVFVAQINPDALTAVGMAFPMQSLMIAFQTGLGVGMNALVSRYLGQKKPYEAGLAATHALILTALNYVIFLIVGLTAIPAFFSIQTHSEIIAGYGVEYLSIVCCGSLGLFFQIYGERILQATGKTLLSMVSQILGAVINIVLDPVFIFGVDFLGIPAMGVTGAAIATVTGQIIAAAVGFLLHHFHNKELRLVFRKFRLNPGTIKTIYAVGIPSIIMSALVSVLTFGMNIILKAYEPAAATVFGVYFKLQSFVYMPVFGMNNGIVPIIAYNYGAGKPKRITDTLKLGVICSVAIMIVGLLLFQLIPVQLLGMFAPTDDMIRLGETALRIFSLSFVFAGVSIVLSSGFQALGNGFYSMIVFIVRLIVPTLPFAWLFGIIGGVDCIWWSLPVSDLLGLIVAILLMRRIYKNVISKMYDKQDESSAQVQQA